MNEEKVKKVLNVHVDDKKFDVKYESEEKSVNVSVSLMDKIIIFISKIFK